MLLERSVIIKPKPFESRFSVLSTEKGKVTKTVSLGQTGSYMPIQLSAKALSHSFGLSGCVVWWGGRWGW